MGMIPIREQEEFVRRIARKFARGPVLSIEDLEGEGFLLLHRLRLRFGSLPPERFERLFRRSLRHRLIDLSRREARHRARKRRIRQIDRPRHEPPPECGAEDALLAIPETAARTIKDLAADRRTVTYPRRSRARRELERVLFAD